MFTGIVAEMGSVVSVEPTGTGRRLVIGTNGLSAAMGLGDSISVNGVCLTAVDVAGTNVTVDVVQETLDRSNLGNLTVSDTVDLERPMPASGRFDGHIVQGHVDGVGTVSRVDIEGEARRVRIDLPGNLSRYVVEKGSVTIDGVSLTVTGVSDNPPWFEVVLIPHTLEVTVLGSRSVGAKVNLEVDVLAKYVERLLEARA
ncbi:MAG: riboflavin synthase [Acidimicrobiia bacterium]|nr:riboflavin synthase [Acidimicrobiia bacterium]